MTDDIDAAISPQQLVRAGYDACADVYATGRSEDDADQLAPLLDVLPEGASVLDIGCGAGVPIARALATQHRVTGIDTSEAMLQLARRNVPAARFVHSDILNASLDENAFDAAVAIFVLFHIPIEDHRRVFERVWSWLRPGGYFLVTLSQQAVAPTIRHDFFGATMYWNKMAFGDSIHLLGDVGFEIVRERIVGRRYAQPLGVKDEGNPVTLVFKPCGRSRA